MALIVVYMEISDAFIGGGQLVDVGDGFWQGALDEQRVGVFVEHLFFDWHSPQPAFVSPPLENGFLFYFDENVSCPVDSDASISGVFSQLSASLTFAPFAISSRTARK